MSKLIYLDNASTTIPCKEAIDPFMNPDNYYNPSNLYTKSREIHDNLDYIRSGILKFLHADKGQVYFTSGASEANNWLFKGIVEEWHKQIQEYYSYDHPLHIITSSIEHDSVLNTLKYQDFGKYFDVTYIDPDEKGYIRVEDIEAAIRPGETGLISIMYANNELGTIQPIYKIGKLCKKKGILFHTDATQIFGKQDIDVSNCNIDFLTFSGHKFHGPKGIGGIYVGNFKHGDKHQIELPNLIYGGGQEFGLRAGTENYPAILGMWNAISYMQQNYIDECAYKVKTRDMYKLIIQKLNEYFKPEDYHINSYYSKWIFNFSLKNVDSDSFIVRLASEDKDEMIYASKGSACNTGNLDPSHVLTAIKCPKEFINGSIRISYDINTTEDDIDAIMRRLSKMYYN